jgi:hypothetical protein
MIDINKKYRTRDGREVRIYALDGGDLVEFKTVHGAILSGENWVFSIWNAKTGTCYAGSKETNIDLIEVKPRIKRTLWVNVYPKLSCTGANHSNKKDADQNAACNRIACVKVEIDCEEGEGL